MEPTTAITAGVFYFKGGGKEMMLKLLGPTADYLGEELKNNVEKQMENLGRIFTKAEDILGEKINQPGQVPPRVLKQIWDEGRFVDDDLCEHYFAGVLASSRSEDGRDDRALTYLELINSMSSYQIRFHYVIYNLIRNLFLDDIDDCGFGRTRSQIAIFIPYEKYIEYMDFSENEKPDLIMSHILSGLDRLNLIGYSTFNDYNSLKDVNPNILSDGILIQPSGLGMDLYLWIHGHSNIPVNYFLDSDIDMSNNEVLSLNPSSIIKVEKQNVNRFRKQFNLKLQ